jgi:hypothetical protein
MGNRCMQQKVMRVTWAEDYFFTLVIFLFTASQA